MGFTNTRGLPYILTYAQADEHFTNKPKPPRSNKWADHERPLKNTASHHYRLEKGEDFYDVVLYHTVMARYYKPDAEGNQRRLYRGHSTTTSKQFMYNVLGVWERRTTTTTMGDMVVAPVYAQTFTQDRTEFFSADYWHNKDGLLIVERSAHTPHYKFVSDENDKARRKATRDALRSYALLAVMRMPEYEHNVTLSHDMGRPFGGETTYATRRAWRQTLESITLGDPTQRELEILFEEIGQNTFDTMASKRGYQQDGFKLSHWYNAHHNSEYADLQKPITASEFEKAFLNTCLRLLGDNVQSGRQELPQFMKKGDYPRTNVHV